MTFTQFLKTHAPETEQPSFIHLARHDQLWPSESDRLEDFESFLIRRLEEESEHVIPELRRLWFHYAAQNSSGKHDLDLALAAWRDYAQHRRTCTGSKLAPCEVEEELFEDALMASSFEDHVAYDSPCDETDVLEDDEDDEREEDDGDEDDLFDDGDGQREAPAEMI